MCEGSFDAAFEFEFESELELGFDLGPKLRRALVSGGRRAGAWASRSV
jgi:hypothetical protein